MPYNRNHVPDTPMTPGMLPRAVTLHDSDFVILVQPVNDPGQKSRTATLSQLAGFIAAGGVSSITFMGENGFVATASGEGFNYHKDATVGDQAVRDFAIDDDGVHVSVTTSNYTKKFETDGTKAVIEKTQGGLVDKVEVFDNYIQITHQTRVANQVVTQTSKLGWDELKARILRVMIDENNAIPFYWDSANSQLVLWAANNVSKIAVPKLHVHGTLDVEKDTTIRADVTIDKTLHVGMDSEFGGNVVIGGYVASKGLSVENKSVFERINLGSAKSYFEISSDSDINALIAGVSEPIEVTEGDIVTVHNTSADAVTVDLGTREGSGGTETKSTTLNALCAMQFICCLKQTTPGATYVQWAPLGNATVTWA